MLFWAEQSQGHGSCLRSMHVPNNAPWRPCCRYDGTVRNSAGEVVQFLYGEDGMDGVRIEKQFMVHLKKKGKALREMYQYEVGGCLWCVWCGGGLGCVCG